jgi:hypothetical protein
MEDVRGHLLFNVSAEEYDEANAWLARAGVMRVIDEGVKAMKPSAGGALESLIDRVESSYLEALAGRGRSQELPAGGG